MKNTNIVIMGLLLAASPLYARLDLQKVSTWKKEDTSEWTQAKVDTILKHIDPNKTGNESTLRPLYKKIAEWKATQAEAVRKELANKAAVAEAQFRAAREAEKTKAQDKYVAALNNLLQATVAQAEDLKKEVAQAEIAVKEATTPAEKTEAKAKVEETKKDLAAVKAQITVSQTEIEKLVTNYKEKTKLDTTKKDEDAKLKAAEDLKNAAKQAEEARIAKEKAALEKKKLEDEKKAREQAEQEQTKKEQDAKKAAEAATDKALNVIAKKIEKNEKLTNPEMAFLESSAAQSSGKIKKQAMDILNTIATKNQREQEQLERIKKAQEEAAMSLKEDAAATVAMDVKKAQEEARRLQQAKTDAEKDAITTAIDKISKGELLSTKKEAPVLRGSKDSNLSAKLLIEAFDIMSSLQRAYKQKEKDEYISDLEKHASFARKEYEKATGDKTTLLQAVVAIESAYDKASGKKK